MNSHPSVGEDVAEPVHEWRETTDQPRSADVTNQKWLGRIDDYQLERLEAENSEEACLGGLIGGLLKIAAKHQTAILKAIDLGGNVLSNPPIQRGIQTYLALMRQIDRFANLQARLSESQWRGGAQDSEVVDEIRKTRLR